MDSLVFDTSAILNFGQRDDLEGLLTKLGTIYKIITTPGVVSELTDPDFHEFNAALLMTHFTQLQPSGQPFDLPTTARLSAAIDPGEISVLVLATDLKATAVIDELAARAEAKKLGIKLTGTIGLINEGLSRGWMTDEECIDKVRILAANQFRIRRPGANQTFAEYFSALA